MAARKHIKVGSRTSPLSLAQNEEVLRLLRARHPDTEFTVVPMATGGDRQKDAPLLSLGRGMFVKDIERALLSGEIDLAIHSAKDLPASLPEGLVIGAICQRRDPRDVLVDRWDLPFDQLPPGARLGTSSPRRVAQLQSVRHDVQFLPMRGNVGTRLAKALGSDYDGVVLAAAGIQRLGMEGRIAQYLSPDLCTPDVGQGALAVEARADDTEVLAMLAGIDHWPSSTAVKAERAFLAAIGGGCRVPVAAYAQVEGRDLRISAMAGAPDGSQVVRIKLQGDASSPEAAGRAAAEALLRAGARDMLARGVGP